MDSRKIKNNRGSTLLELITVILIIATLGYIASPLFSRRNSNFERNIFKVQIEEILNNAKLAAKTSVDNAKVSFVSNKVTITLENDATFEEIIELSKNVAFTTSHPSITISPVGTIAEIAEDENVVCTYKLRNEGALNINVSKYLNVDFQE